MSFLNVTRLARFALLALALIAVGAATADARGGRGFSMGSRGARTAAPPPPTATAPRTAQPMNRTATQPSAATARPGATAATAGSRFGGGFGGLLMGGLLGAGLFGLLSGHGLFGGMGGLASLLGLALQVGLIVIAVKLAMGFFRNRTATAAGPDMQRTASNSAPPASGNVGGSGMAGAMGQPMANAATSQQSPLEIVKDDYEAFQGLLTRIQDAYGREAVGELRGVTTPEMLGYFTEEIEDNKRNNVHNLVSDAKLLSGDLSEAWSEGDAEYATVAMRFSVLDTVVERGTGRIVSGNAEVPTEATELWTFRRPPGGSVMTWKLSAIQQAA